MAREILKRLWARFMSELWGFFALSGLLALHTGIILTVYAVKEVTSHNDVVRVFGIALIILGVIGVIFSWIFHRQQREKRPLCPWGRYVCPCCRCCESGSSWDGGSTRGSSRKNRELNPSVFSTPEFRRYSAFLKDATAGVERSPEEIQVSARLHRFSNDSATPLAASSLTSSSQASPTVSSGHNFIRVASRNEGEDIMSRSSRDTAFRSQAFVDV